jgi:PAS domain S-box-containing protein
MYSNHSSIEKIQSLEISEDLKKLRVMLLSAMVSYPLWGLFSKYMVPTAYDPIGQRLALSCIAGFLLLTTYLWKEVHNNLVKYSFMAWLYSYHLLFLYWKNADTAYYVIINLIQFPYLVLLFPNKSTAQIYTYTKMVAVVIFALFVPYKAINPWFYVLCIVTLGHYLLTILTQHFNVLANLKHAKKEFELALSNMLEGVIMMDSEGIITAYNNTAESILDFKGNSHIGKPYKETSLYKNSLKENLDFYTEENHPLTKAINQNLAIHNTVMGMVKPTGEKRWLLINIQPMRNNEKYILVSFSDLTIVKKNQEKKDQDQAQMAMNARLSSMFAVAGGIAHEINNPLGIIIPHLHILEKKIKADTFDKEVFLNSIQKMTVSAHRVTDIVSGLLTLSKRADELPMVTVSLTEILGNTLKLCRESLKQQDINLIIDEIPNAEIKCRGVQISQVILNLLNNASDAIADQKEKWIHFSFKETNDDVYVSVCDSGPPISDITKERMMEPFFTTKEVGKGTGLGLSVSKAVIEEHGGLLYLDKSAANTCFVIQLKKQI